MYRQEVPQYGTLIELVRDVNEEVMAADPALKARLEAADELSRLDVERHGAIRLGTAEELFNIRRMFATMGMAPVGYYDLSVAGLPVHSTAFRPTTTEALSRNPFRVFTSLIRLELLEDRALAAEAEEILSRRAIVTPRCLELIAEGEAQGGLTRAQAEEFVAEALETFRWHSDATVTAGTYARLAAEHRLIADVVCFRGPHINHLTPRTLDIDAVQARMPERGIAPKAVIEGPPRRAVDILLRQTSFKALEEPILFPGEGGSNGEEGTHTARFGEIEQRGVALTPLGRDLYDRCLAEARSRAAVGATGEGAEDYMDALAAAFIEFPDDADRLRREGLAFFRYRVAGPLPEGVEPVAEAVEDLLAAGALVADPQTYEDFLPVSAAGIFQSNLGTDAQSNFDETANQDVFEAALGCAVTSETALYRDVEETSLTEALAALAGGAG
ncbi:VOC family protein [Pseudooceanicola marinus]|uniref:2-oxoadipate dioxygenase/decarboxylase HglS n=1 Tax=Pseudooceanicola marinus TaxID=396013 RepID=UPI00296E98AE|nr:VOC family protein [Pseudooceanicola marinus]